MKPTKKDPKEKIVIILIGFFLILSLTSIFLLKARLTGEQENSLQNSPIISNRLRYIAECKEPLFMALEKQTEGSCGTSCIPDHPPITLHHYGKCKTNKKGILKSFNLGDSFMEDFVGDGDGDGFREVVLIPLEDSQVFYVYSGKTGNLVIKKNIGVPIKKIFGLEDVNGDGKGDVAIRIANGLVSGSGQIEFSKVRIYDGATGNLISEINPSSEQAWEQFGDYVENLGDLNGNGMNELGISSPKYDSTIDVAHNGGKTRIYSFSQGSFNELDAVFGAQGNFDGITGIGPLGNLNGGSDKEFYISGDDIMSVYSFTSGNGVFLKEIVVEASLPIINFAEAIDFTNDGNKELIIAQPKAYSLLQGIFGLVEIYDPNLVTLYWSKTNEKILSLDSQLNTHFGRDIAIIDDITGDGIEELVISASGGWAKHNYNNWMGDLNHPYQKVAGVIYILDVVQDEVIQRYLGDVEYQGLGHRLTSIE